MHLFMFLSSVTIIGMMVFYVIIWALNDYVNSVELRMANDRIMKRSRKMREAAVRLQRAWRRRSAKINRLLTFLALRDGPYDRTQLAAD